MTKVIASYIDLPYVLMVINSHNLQHLMICNIIEQFINYYILQFYFSYHALNCQGLVFDGCLTLSYHPCTFTQKQSSKNQKMTVRCNRFNKSIKINLQTNLYTFQVYNSPFMNYNSCETCIFKYFL